MSGYKKGRYGAAPFSVSPTGTLVYRTKVGYNAELAWFDREGKRLGTVGPPGDYGDPELSPDGKRVGVDLVEGGNQDIWTLEVADGQMLRLTFDAEIDHIPIWSPDGTRIAFDSHRAGAGDMYEKLSNGAGPEQTLLKWKLLTSPNDWSQDGRFIAFTATTPDTKVDVWVLPTEEPRTPFPYLRTTASESSARFAPNGRWLTYVSNESGRDEVYVGTFNGTAAAAGGGKWQISTTGGSQPAWSKDGKELFYLAADNKLMAVEVRPESTFAAGTPRVLFDTHLMFRRGPRNDYAISADGRRFLLRVPFRDPTTEPIHVFVNWPRVLRP